MSESLGLSKEQSKNLMKFISDNISMPVLGAGGGYAPIGTVIMRLSSTAPQGFLLCDGTVYNIKDYPDLATHFASDPEIGSVNAYGGDGIATFAVPDLRGEFIRMCGTNSHTNQGDGSSKIGQHQDSSYIPYLRIDKENNYLAIGVDKDKGYDIPINFEKGFLSKKRYVFNGTNTSGQYVDIDYNTGTIYGIRPTNTSLNFYIKATVSGDASGEVYSTDETIYGTWIDGKPIYQTTIEYTFPNPLTKDTPPFSSQINMSELPIGTHQPDILVGCDVFLTGADNGITQTAKGAWDCRVWSAPTGHPEIFVGFYQDIDSTTLRTITKLLMTIKYTARS